MEEKLYFAPANYGKGAKRAEKTADSLATQKKSKEKKNHKILKLGGFLLILAIAIIVIIWLLHGKTTTSGQYPENVKNEALTCESSTVAYPKITKANSDSKKLKINLIFNNDAKLKNTSLVYTIYYDDEEEVKKAEAFAHAEFNLGLNANGYSSTKFNNKFARYNNSLIISLFANASEIDEYTAPYFMIERDDYKFPETIVEYEEMYEAQGFSCNSTKE